MPLPQNFYAFLGAGVVGVVCAATLYVVEQIRQDKRRHGLAKDLARLDTELTVLRQELNQYLALQKEKAAKSRKKKGRNESVASSATAEDYASACDSDDLEFYDVSDDDDTDNTAPYDLRTILEEIDVSLDEGTLKEVEMCLERLRLLRLEHPDNPQILWRVAKAHHKLLQKTDDKDIIMEHVSQGLDACDKALGLKPELMEVHKWTAILIGERTEHVSIKEKLQMGLRFKAHVERAIELQHEDPVLHHMLGRFLFEYAKLKWYERKVAALIGEIPDASYEQALELFLKAEEFSKKEWKENKLWLGKCYLALGNTEEALKWLQDAEGVKTDNGLDEKVDKEVKDLLEKRRS